MFQEWCTLHDIFFFSLSVSTSQLRTATTNILCLFASQCNKPNRLPPIDAHNNSSQPSIPTSRLNHVIFLLNLSWSKVQNAATVSHMWRHDILWREKKKIRFDESRCSVYFDLRFRLRSYVCQGHPTTVFCKISVGRSKHCLDFSITLACIAGVWK